MSSEARPNGSIMQHLFQYLCPDDYDLDFIDNVLNRPLQPGTLFSTEHIEMMIKKVVDECPLLQTNDQYVLWPRYHWNPIPRFGYIQIWSVQTNGSVGEDGPKEILAAVRLHEDGTVRLMHYL